MKTWVDLQKQDLSFAKNKNKQTKTTPNYIYICTYISLTIIINNNKNPSNTRYSWVLHTLKTMVLSILSPDKICLQQCLNIGFSFWSEIRSLCLDARQVMINRHLLVKVIGRISSGNSWDRWRCLIFADVVVTPAKRSLGFQIYDTLWMETVLIVLAGKTCWWFCFLL